MITPGASARITRVNDEDRMVGRSVAGKYRIDAWVGAGSMGALYRARHLTLDKDVCVKIMHDEVARDPDLAERFQREARAASRLDHPCSVRVLDFGEEPDGLLYIVMELIEGRDLFDLADGAPLAAERIVDIMTQVLSALAAAHDVGVLHRDLKPENIMVGPATDADDGIREREPVKVCDFGIAHIAEPHRTGRRITSRGFIVGTPEYMSPEQTRSELPDPRSDLYSVGVILFQLLTGRLPFEADSPLNIALMHLGQEPPRPRDLNPAAHPELEAICLRALRKAPAERFASAREMRNALRSALTSEPRPRTDERETLTEAEFEIDIDVDTTDVAAEPIALPLGRRSFERRSTKRVSAFMAAALLVGLAGVTVARRQHLALPRIAIMNAAAALIERPTMPAENGPVVVSAPALPAPAELAPSATPAVDAPPPPPSSAAPRPEAIPARVTTPLRVVPARAPKIERASEPAVLPPAPTEPPRETMVTPEPAPTSAPPPPPSPTAEQAPEAVVAAAPPPAAPPAPSPPPRFIVESAHVDIGSAAQIVGATSASFDRALAPSRAKVDACYREALPSLQGAPDGFGVLHVETDEVGNVRHAEVKGAHAADLGACIARAVIGSRVRNVDTGTASAEVPLSYRAR